MWLVKIFAESGRCNGPMIGFVSGNNNQKPQNGEICSGAWADCNRLRKSLTFMINMSDLRDRVRNRNIRRPTLGTGTEQLFHNSAGKV